MGKKYKHLNDYREKEVMTAMGLLPLSGSFTPQYYIEDENKNDTINPETIEELIEYQTAENTLNDKELNVYVRDILDSLTPREAKILRLRFGIDTVNEVDYTLEEVGKMYGVTREAIRRIEAKALRKMRHPSRSDKLKSFLGSGFVSTIWAELSEPMPEFDEEDEWDSARAYKQRLEAWSERVTAAAKKIREAKARLASGVTDYKLGEQE